jgi:hypothetical protein
MSIPAIETRYGGYRFRSRLEARWAVFFDHMHIAWQYEPQGFIVAGRPYLPDFLLTECGTWVEVKGAESELDHDLMLAAAELLPEADCIREQGPRLLILGPIPAPCADGDLGWIGLSPVVGSFDGPSDEVSIVDQWWGFGGYHKNMRPWVLANTSSSTPVQWDSGPWLSPMPDLYEAAAAEAGYEAARGARFEHGQSGAGR